MSSPPQVISTSCPSNSCPLHFLSFPPKSLSISCPFHLMSSLPQFLSTSCPLYCLSSRYILFSPPPVLSTCCPLHLLSFPPHVLFTSYPLNLLFYPLLVLSTSCSLHLAVQIGPKTTVPGLLIIGSVFFRVRNLISEMSDTDKLDYPKQLVKHFMPTK